MSKKDLTTLMCIVISVINVLLFISLIKPEEKLELKDISKTESSLILHTNNQELHIPKEKLEEYFLIDLDDIVDWNTDGEEIAISLENGNELYSTKSENIYAPKFKRYVGFDEIQDISETETTYELTTKDGNTYTVNK